MSAINNNLGMDLNNLGTDLNNIDLNENKINQDKIIQDKITAFVDPYVVLGVSKEESEEKIRVRFLKLSLMHHPDKGGDPQKYAEIVKAYTSIKNNTAASAMAKHIPNTFDQIKQEYRDLNYRSNDEFMVKDERGKCKFDNLKFINAFQEKNRANFQEEYGAVVHEHEQKCQKTLAELLKDREEETRLLNVQLQKQIIPDNNFDRMMFMANTLFAQKEIEEIVHQDNFAGGSSTYALFDKNIPNINHLEQFERNIKPNKKPKEEDTRTKEEINKQAFEKLLAERNAPINYALPGKLPPTQTQSDLLADLVNPPVARQRGWLSDNKEDNIKSHKKYNTEERSQILEQVNKQAWEQLLKDRNLIDVNQMECPETSALTRENNSNLIPSAITSQLMQDLANPSAVVCRNETCNFSSPFYE